MEWTVVTVVIALVGLFLSVGKPIITLNSSITKLNMSIENLKAAQTHQEDELKQHKIHAHESHQRLWDHNDKQDKKIDEHERRIAHLEVADK